MKSNRRHFLATGAAGLTAAAVCNMPASAKAADPFEANVKKAKLRLSSQFRIIPGKSAEAKMAQMTEWGFEAVEPWGRDLVDNTDGKKLALKRAATIEKTTAFKKAADKAGLKVSVICYGSTKGMVVSDVAEKRAEGIENVKLALEAAEILGAGGVIYVPAFDRELKDNKFSHKEIRKILVDTLPMLGEVALKHNTKLIMEPLNRKEAYFLRQVADGAAIARDCNNDGIRVMGDFYHMTIEEPSDLGAFLSGGDKLKHVHLASRLRDLPGQDDKRYVDGFRGLKMIGYQGYCSFECRVKKGTDPMVEVPKSMQFLRDQWAKADV